MIIIIIILSILLILSFIVNIGLFIYIRDNIKFLLDIKDELDSITDIVDDYKNHLYEVSKMDRYTGESTIESLMEHTNIIYKELKDRFLLIEDIFQNEEQEDGEEEKTEE